LEEKLEDI
jgi:seryl-tRNA(Sec) selenium transferase